MALRLGDSAPNFTAQSTEGLINFYDWMGSQWAVLFSHPKDFTPVCTTELGEVAKLKSEFEKRNCRIIAVSVDPVSSHNAWINDINETQHTKVNFPLLGDEDRKVAMLYDMIHPNASDSQTVRSVFIIAPDKKIKLTLTYPASTGRDFNEILRALDSVQLTSKYSVATPVNWHVGDDCIVLTSISNDELASRFPKGVKIVKPYLRITPQPNIP